MWLLGWPVFSLDSRDRNDLPAAALVPVAGPRASAVSLGLIEGAAEGVNSLLKVISGWLSDRSARRKPIVVGGYAISSLARPFIAITNTWQQVLAIRVLDRMGKGIRGAPRDAMLAQFASPSTRGRIFGFHRAMDHTGAIVGPLAATTILFFAPESYRLVFGLTIIPGLIAVWLLMKVPETTVAAEAIGVAGARLRTRLIPRRRMPGQLHCRIPAHSGPFMRFFFCLRSEIPRMRSLLLRLATRFGGRPTCRSCGLAFISSKRRSRHGAAASPTGSAVKR